MSVLWNDIFLLLNSGYEFLLLLSYMPLRNQFLFFEKCMPRISVNSVDKRRLVKCNKNLFSYTLFQQSRFLEVICTGKTFLRQTNWIKNFIKESTH